MSLMEREEFSVKKIIQELQEAADLGDAPKRGPFAVFVRKEYLVEAIAKLRDYQDLQSSDTSARLAAIKDIPTERVIALAQAEAAGLVSISAATVEGAYQEEKRGDGWISVRDRTPASYTFVLIADAEKNITISWIDNDGIWERGGGNVTVTHWRPLPEPPEEA